MENKTIEENINNLQYMPYLMPRLYELDFPF